MKTSRICFPGWRSTAADRFDPQPSSVAPHRRYRGQIALLALALLVIGGCAKPEHSPEGETQATGGGQPKFFCPMHPTYTSSRPGDCPICNMKLVPAQEGQAAPAGGEEHVAGRVTVMLTPEKQQLIGLRTTPVALHELSFTVHASALVQHDETRYAVVAPRFGGWVRQLYVSYTGAPVQQGAPLLSVYSPEVRAAENDYLIAWRQAKHAVPGADADALLEIARQKLRLWEIAEPEIKTLEERGQVSDTVLVRAPFTGHVLQRNVTEGQAFQAGETLLAVAVLDPIWVRLSLAESDFVHVQLHQKVWLEFPHLGPRTYEGRITFISPHMDSQTRRGEARVELPNPGGVLRPDMWAQAEIEVELGERLAVPASAVLDTGTRTLAFVLREDDHLEPREVQIGLRTDNWWEVTGGLEAGEQVVTRALFLVDAESQLKAAIAGMGDEHP